MKRTGATANADIRLPVPGRPGVHVLAGPGTGVDVGLIGRAMDARGSAAAVGLAASALEVFGSLRRWLAFRDPSAAALMYSGPEAGADASGVPQVLEHPLGGQVQRS